MIKSYYDMLGLPQQASADEIKHAFRREIAKYHPDKVQHLGAEFQSIAAVKAAELTQAYRTLSDIGLRADYDAQLGSDGGLDPEPPAARPAAPAAERPSESPQRAPVPP